MKDLKVYRAAQTGVEIPQFAQRWGFVKISDLAAKMDLPWEEIQHRYGALGKPMCESMGPGDEYIDLTPKVFQFSGFVSAGWVKEILSAQKLGVHHVTLELWDEDEYKLIPSNLWKSGDMRIWDPDGRVLLAFAYNSEGGPVKWPVQIVAKCCGRQCFYSRGDFETAVANGLELFPDWGGCAVDLSTGEIFGWKTFDDQYEEVPYYWFEGVNPSAVAKNHARIDWLGR